MSEFTETLALIGATLTELQPQLPAIAPALREAGASITATLETLSPDQVTASDQVARCAGEVLRRLTAAALSGIGDGHTSGVLRLQGALDGLVVLVELRRAARRT